MRGSETYSSSGESKQGRWRKVAPWLGAAAVGVAGVEIVNAAGGNAALEILIGGLGAIITYNWIRHGDSVKAAGR